jgi:nucleoside 2-deoxyribosyltransferase
MLIGFTGYARSGKDSASQMLVERFGFQKLAFADGVRVLAAAIDPYVDCGRDTHFTEGNSPFARYTELLRARGYEQAKACPDVRRLLQRIGTEAARAVFGDNVWVRLLSDKLCEMNALGPDGAGRTNVAISDVRYQNEAEFIQRYGGIVVRIVRPGYGGNDTHTSEASIVDIDVDATLTATNLDELSEQVMALMDNIDALINAQQQRLSEQREKMVSWTPVATEPEPPRVYLAGPWACKAEVADAKQRMLAAGIQVVSGWTERENTPQEIEPARMQKQAALDMAEVFASNTLVLMGLAKSEGKATEMGMALALGKRVILVKDDCVGNIFYNLTQVERVDTLESAISLLTDGYAFTIHSTLVEPNPNAILIPVRTDENGDKVHAETGEIVARRLGVITDIAEPESNE